MSSGMTMFFRDLPILPYSRGLSPDDRLVEMIELPEGEHPWFVASQAHPEFKSRPTKPAPLFREFVRAAIAHHEGLGRHEIMPVDPATR